MQVKTKLKLQAPLIALRLLGARRLSKKIKKYDDESRYPQQWRNDYALTKSKKYLKLIKANITVKGYENIPQKSVAVLTPNHASGFDPVILLAALEKKDKSKDESNPKVVFLGKRELMTNRLAKNYASILSTFFIDRSKPREALDVIDKMVKHAKENKKLIAIFPEGTRSIDGKIADFKGGAFKSAKQYFLPIIPVTINNSPGCSNLKRTNAINVEVIFHPLIKPSQIMTMDTTSIGALVKKRVESAWKEPIEKRGDAEKSLTGSK